MIEIIIGLGCLLGGLGLGLGLLQDFVRLGALEFAAGGLGVGVGFVMLAHGLYRRWRDSRDSGDRHRIRSIALMVVMLIAGLVLVAIASAVLAPVTVSGISFGYHVMAELVPLLLLFLFFVFYRRQAAIDLDDLATALPGQEQPHGR